MTAPQSFPPLPHETPGNSVFHGGGGNRTRATFPPHAGSRSGSRAHARQVDSDRLQVTFHPSLPVHAQRLMAALDVEVLFDENAPTRYECAGCRAYRQAENAQRLSRIVRRLVRAGVCPLHRGPQPCAACERDEVEP